MNSYAQKYDAIVVGGGVSGIPAAAALGEMGQKVLLIEKMGFVGGTAAVGIPMLGFLDKHGRKVTGGFAQRIVDRMIANNECFDHRRCPINNSVTIFNAETFKLTALDMCLEAGVEILLNSELIDVIVDNGAIRGITVISKGIKMQFSAEIYIDATGDGDLAYMSGCRYEKGQTGSGELMPPTVMFSLSGFDENRFTEYLHQHPEQLSYGDRVEGRGYNADYFSANRNYVFGGFHKLFTELKERGECPVDRETFIYINDIEPGTVHINSIRLLGTDVTDAYQYTQAEIKGFKQIPNIIYTLKKDIPGFENVRLKHIAPVLGIRESRRFIGMKYLALDDILHGALPSDRIALGSYKVDVPSSSDAATQFADIDKPYGIPYGCIVSKDIDNLMLAGRLISVSALVLGSTRVMTTCMALGEAAGTASALALAKGVLPKEVEGEEVALKLRERGAILDYTGEE